MATKPIGVRVDERGLKILDGVIEELKFHNPNWEPTRSDAIRHVIASSGSAANLPPGSKPPEPDKPMLRSG